MISSGALVRYRPTAASHSFSFEGFTTSSEVGMHGILTTPAAWRKAEDPGT
jgi:hypothetical protein